MNRSNRQQYGSEEKSTDDRPRVRDAHVVLGTDADGRIHHRSLVDDAVYWIDQDGTVVRRKVVPDGRVDDYVEAVADGRGWAEINYGPRATARAILAGPGGDA
jgi:hypothetical protein